MLSLYTKKMLQCKAFNNINKKKMTFDLTLTTSFISLFQILVSIFILSQGIIVIIQNPYSNSNRSFFFFQFCMFLWMIGMGLGYFSTNDFYTLIFLKIGFIAVSTIPMSTYIFSSYFRSEKPKDSFVIIGTLTTLLVAINIILDNPFFIKGIIHYDWGNYMLIGPGSVLSILLFAFFMFLFGRNLHDSYIKAERRKKWYLLAFISGMLSFLGIVDFLPGYGLWMPIHPPGFIFVGVLASFMGYFMIRYNLADIKLVLGRAIGHAFTIGILAVIYILLFVFLLPGNKTTTDFIFYVTFFILGIYLFNLFIRGGKKLADEIFNKDQKNFEIKIDKFEKQLYHFENLDKFSKEIFDFIEDSLRIENPFFLIINEKDKSWSIIKPSGLKIESQKIPMQYKGAIKMSAEEDMGPIDVEEIYNFNEIIKEAISLSKENKGIMLVPLVTRSNIIGFLVFGKQLTKQSFSFKEKEALKYLASAVSISWENVRLFENIERENRIKMDFITIASHQLRTPLTRLKWALEMMSSKPNLENDIKNIVSELATSTDNMISMVGQLLGVAEFEKGEIIETSKFLIYPVINEVLSKKEGEANTKGVSIKIENKEKETEVVFSKHSLIIIVETLIDNAIQYTKKGGNVNISIHKTNKDTVEVQIADNGIGIPKDEQNNIFNKFFRGNNATSIRPDGTGLGLYYAKLLTEKQGGDIYFSSNEGEGSVFHIILPAI